MNYEDVSVPRVTVDKGGVKCTMVLDKNGDPYEYRDKYEVGFRLSRRKEDES